MTVTANDQYNNVAKGYTGIVHFTSSDVQAVLPANYTFVAGDNGVHTFTNLTTLKTSGNQTITGTDTVTASDRKSTRLNSSHPCISYAVFCLKKPTTISS